VKTLRHADFLVHRMQADLAAAAVSQPDLAAAAVLQQPDPAAAAVPQPPLRVYEPSSAPRQDLPEVAAARSWFTGKSVGVILLVLGALCVLAAGVIFVAVAWADLSIAIRSLILIVITAGFGYLAQLALRRGLQATAEAMAGITCSMFILDLAAARRAGLPGLAGLAAAPYEILAGILLVAAAGGAGLAVRNQGAAGQGELVEAGFSPRQYWLWSLDAAVAFGMARAAVGVLRVSRDGYAVSTVTVTVLAALLYLLWRRLRFPVATRTAAALGGMGWLAAVSIGTQRAANHVDGGDVGRLAQAWPALAVAMVAAFGATCLTDAAARRVTACMSILPALMVFEVVAWSHGWVVGSVVTLVGYVIAALASGRVPASWSPAVGGSALVLGMSSLVGLQPTLVALSTRIELALDGSWGGPLPLPPGLQSGDIGPWLLPVTTVVILALLPQITIDNERLSLDRHHAAGVFVATLGLLPMMYGAGFWASMTALTALAAILLRTARLWLHDSLLVLGLSLLAVVRVCAYYDRLADPLAWTLLGVACLAWALTERRPAVRAGFLTATGLLALLAAAQWLTFAQVSRPLHGLVIVGIGSLGLLASQMVRERALTAVVSTRVVCEGLSVTWVVVGLLMADRSPWHRAVELTVAGVATGITAHLSEDRRGAGWVSGVLLTVASWIRLTDSNVQAVEWYTVPAATALLVYGVRRLRQDPSESSWGCLGPGLTLALTPSLLLALGEPVSLRALLVGLASVALVALGVRVRLAGPFALGVVGIGLLALRNLWPVAAFIPLWTLLSLTGAALLGTGMTWEARVNDVHTASRYVRGLR